jgi:hypothetical protein
MPDRWRSIALGVVALAAIEGCGGGAARSEAPATPLTPTGISMCGVERWSVKTLADADAVRVDRLAITPTTIPALNDLPPHCSGLPDARTYPEEFRIYEVTGIVLHARNEDDRDVHVAVADPDDPRWTMVVEVIDPSCATTSPLLATLAGARAQYETLKPLPGRRIRIRGVGFYDAAHGQTGRAQSCFELHPVLSISTQ